MSALDDAEEAIYEDEFRLRNECLDAYKEYLNSIKTGEVYSLSRRMKKAELNTIVPNNGFPCYDIMERCWFNKIFSDKQWKAIINVMAFYLWKYNDFGINAKLGLWEREEQLAFDEAMREEF